MDLLPAYLYSPNSRSARSSTRSRAFPLWEYSSRLLISSFRGEPADALAVAQYLDSPHSPRYRQDGGHTYCNVYAADFCQLLNVYLPRVWWTDQALLEGIPKAAVARLGVNAHELSANDIHSWLELFGGGFGWERLPDIESLQQYVARGFLGIVTGKSKAGPGHVAVVLHASLSNPPHVFQSQSGVRNVIADYLPKWWEGLTFSSVEFWANRPSHPHVTASGRRGIRSWAATLVEASFSSSTGYLGRMIDHHLRQHADRLPDSLVEALVFAEDRRFFRHSGFDLRAMARALVSIVLQGKLQGASTIEQQLVRTLTGSRSKTIGRKLREVILAYWCAEQYDKRSLAELYIRIAYYGSNADGLQNVCTRLGFNLKLLSLTHASQIVAALRHPIPSELPKAESHPWVRRAKHIEAGLLARSAH